MKEERPYVMCLMMTSVDGKILGEKWGSSPQVKTLINTFEKAHEQLGIGAWIVAIVSLFIDIPINTQIIVFISASLVSVVLFRSWLKKKLGTIGVNSKQLEDEFIGKIGKAETQIVPGSNGKIDFKGTIWDASSDDMISAGEHVIITETRSILLIVKSLKSV